MNEIKVVVTYRPKDSSQVLQQEYDIEAASDPTLTDIITDFASALKDDHQIRMTLDMLKECVNVGQGCRRFDEYLTESCIVLNSLKSKAHLSHVLLLLIGIKVFER
jgi:hypothetical protein